MRSEVIFFVPLWVTAFTILAFVNRKVLFDKIILAPKEADFPTTECCVSWVTF